MPLAAADSQFHRLSSPPNTKRAKTCQAPKDTAPPANDDDGDDGDWVSLKFVDGVPLKFVDFREFYQHTGAYLMETKERKWFKKIWDILLESPKVQKIHILHGKKDVVTKVAIPEDF